MNNGLRNLLVEIGTEELPPLALDALSRAFEYALRDQAYRDIHSGDLADSEVSSLLNVNREILNSSTSLAMALREYNAAIRETAIQDDKQGAS